MRVNSESSEDVTALLLNWQNGGDEDASARLMPLVYEELRRVARAYLQRERADHTLQATALVHEAYLQLVDDNESDLEGSRAFLRHRRAAHAANSDPARAGASRGQARRTRNNRNCRSRKRANCRPIRPWNYWRSMTRWRI